MKTVRVYPPCFTQDDDLRRCLAQYHQDAKSALEGYTATMEAMTAQLRAIVDTLRGQEVEITAGSCFLVIDGPDEVLDRLLAQGLDIEEERDEQE